MKDRTFAERLQAHIEASPDLTPAGLAVAAGLDNSTIRQLLAGKIQNPRLDTAMKICAALGTTIEDFMGNHRTEEDRRILRLVTQLPAPRRLQLLGYGEALASLPPDEPESSSPAVLQSPNSSS